MVAVAVDAHQGLLIFALRRFCWIRPFAIVAFSTQPVDILASKHLVGLHFVVFVRQVALAGTVARFAAYTFFEVRRTDVFVLDIHVAQRPGLLVEWIRIPGEEQRLLQFLKFSTGGSCGPVCHGTATYVRSEDEEFMEEDR